jgi:hypothetical protein
VVCRRADPPRPIPRLVGMHGPRRLGFALALAGVGIVVAGAGVGLRVAETSTPDALGVSDRGHGGELFTLSAVTPAGSPAPDPVWASGPTADADRQASKPPTPFPLGALSVVVLVVLGSGVWLARRQAAGAPEHRLLVPCGLRAPPGLTAI